MELSELKERLEKLGYDIETCGRNETLYYLRGHGTIIDFVDDEDLYNLGQLEEKLFILEGGKK